MINKQWRSKEKVLATPLNRIGTIKPFDRTDSYVSHHFISNSCYPE